MEPTRCCCIQVAIHHIWDANDQNSISRLNRWICDPFEERMGAKGRALVVGRWRGFGIFRHFPEKSDFGAPINDLAGPKSANSFDSCCLLLCLQCRCFKNRQEALRDCGGCSMIMPAGYLGRAHNVTRNPGVKLRDSRKQAAGAFLRPPISIQTPEFVDQCFLNFRWYSVYPAKRFVSLILQRISGTDRLTLVLARMNCLVKKMQARDMLALLL